MFLALKTFIFSTFVCTRNVWSMDQVHFHPQKDQKANICLICSSHQELNSSVIMQSVSMLPKKYFCSNQRDSDPKNTFISCSFTQHLFFILLNMITVHNTFNIIKQNNTLIIEYDSINIKSITFTPFDTSIQVNCVYVYKYYKNNNICVI